MNDKKCSKCNGEMEQGTFGGLYGNIVPWAKGSMFLKWVSDRNESRTVVVYRCKTCGYLETFAQ